jgi:hypothetical protein
MRSCSRVATNHRVCANFAISTLTSRGSRGMVRAVLSHPISRGAPGVIRSASQNDLPCVVRVEGDNPEPVFNQTKGARVGGCRSCLHWKTKARPRSPARCLMGNGSFAVTAKWGIFFKALRSHLLRSERFCFPGLVHLPRRTRSSRRWSHPSHPLLELRATILGNLLTGR